MREGILNFPPPPYKFSSQGWRDGPQCRVRTTFAKDQSSVPSTTSGGSQLLVALALSPSCGLPGYCTYAYAHTYTHTDTDTHTIQMHKHTIHTDAHTETHNMNTQTQTQHRMTHRDTYNADAHRQIKTDTHTVTTINHPLQCCYQIIVLN